VNELTDVNPLLAINEIVLKKKKIISMKEHYGLEDRNILKGRHSPSGKSSYYMTIPESFLEL
jgi:hypothetical protein